MSMTWRYPVPSVRHGTFMEWWLYPATLLGWLLSSIFVLALARLARGTWPARARPRAPDGRGPGGRPGGPP